ncbi:MAG: hypothetical protein ISS78_03755 [Phycisphaerae bacterium]|nr:hypothetical protein [Phycisphaerae bacterium]
MRTKNHFVRVASVFICGCLLAPAGCTKEIWIVQYPEFYQEGEIKSVAVMPFRCPAAPRSTGGIIIADGLAAALMNNGTYQRVYNRSDLRALLAEHDLKDLFSDNPVSAAKALKKVTNAQAMITGSVTAYSATSRDERRKEPQYEYDDDGKRRLVGYRRYVHTRNEANVAVTASLIRVSDGTSIYALPAPATGRAWAQGSPPRYDASACLSSAVNQVVLKLLVRFAVVRRKIKVDPNKALRTASELYDNKWIWKDTFKADEENMFVVVKLPPSCDRNKFRMVVVRKNTRKDLTGLDIVWTKKHSSYGYLFSPKAIAEAGGGPGEFTIKFYSGPEPAITRNFRIVP